MTNPAKGPRRVVVGPGPDGPSVADETLPASLETEAVTISDIWLTQDGEKTADYAPGADPWSLLPPDHGTTWRLVEFKAGHAPEDITTGMHETPTVDTGVILSGSISLVLEDASTVELGAGDLFVLRGAQHTWANLGSESCVMCITLVRSH
jgi:quercetin dioxygenase-like cupin family protein